MVDLVDASGGPRESACAGLVSKNVPDEVLRDMFAYSRIAVTPETNLEGIDLAQVSVPRRPIKAWAPSYVPMPGDLFNTSGGVTLLTVRDNPNMLPWAARGNFPWGSTSSRVVSWGYDVYNVPPLRDALVTQVELLIRDEGTCKVAVDYCLQLLITLRPEDPYRDSNGRLLMLWLFPPHKDSTYLRRLDKKP